MNGEQLTAIASLYNCSCDYLLCRTATPDFEPVRSQPILTSDERRLLEAYRASDERGQLTILAAAEREASMPDAVAKKDARLSA